MWQLNFNCELFDTFQNKPKWEFMSQHLHEASLWNDVVAELGKNGNGKRQNMSNCVFACAHTANDDKTEWSLWIK